ncbi:MTH938/NDUFAF3 family protein [Methanomassiliicoccus luminyensis]|jgi:hypothetical protein|uniref:MTH938/NDUFAF3 family protein n=1 Tax=Methanomassiliicoccus luminyensis TaxID=1080712 RepID=UPI00037D48A0|nr:MTH938/NDUFAF3 family protein [Methanomassiliicoccus luminyensis]
MDGADGYFGWVRVGGRKYVKDVIVHVDGSVTERPTELSLDYRSDYFHTPLSERELGFLDGERPEVVIVGAGYKSMMPLTPQAKAVLERYDLVVRSTSDAIEIMNRESRRFVAILHLTC